MVLSSNFEFKNPKDESNEYDEIQLEESEEFKRRSIVEEVTPL